MKYFSVYCTSSISDFQFPSLEINQQYFHEFVPFIQFQKLTTSLEVTIIVVKYQFRRRNRAATTS